MKTLEKKSPRPDRESGAGERTEARLIISPSGVTSSGGRISEADLLSRFEKVRRTDNGSWIACCPAHEDHTPSLSIKDAGDKWLLKCHVGCSYDAILKAAKLEPKEMADRKDHEPHASRRIVKVYSYADHDGKPVFEVVRYEPKDFRQRVPDASAKGGYTYSTKDLKWFPIYRLPSVAEAIKSRAQIHLAEGEKDADTLASCGMVGTTIAMGAKKWKPEYAEQLKDADLVIWPDNDSPGVEHAKNLIEKLRDCKSISVVPMPDGVKDVSDLAATGEELTSYRDLHIMPAKDWLDNIAPIIMSQTAMAVMMPDDANNEKNRPDDIFEGLPSTELTGGRFKFETHLLDAVMEKDPFFDNIHLNEMTGHVEWRGNIMDNCDLTTAEVYVSKTYRWSGKKDSICEIMEMKAKTNSINPVLDYLKEAATAWDKTPRLRDLKELLHHDGSDYANNVIEILFLQAVARIYEPGSTASVVPVLVGRQGCGKSSFVRALVPNPEWFSDSLKVDHLHDAKRAQEAIGGAWIVEIAELAGMGRSEIESVKAWISAAKDIFRAPYKRKEETRKRRFIVVGTSNDTNFLQDPTGNRRFAPVVVDPGGFVTIPPEQLLQLWGEAVHRYRANEHILLLQSIEKALREERNALHEAPDPLREAIAELTEKQKTSSSVEIEMKMDDILRPLGIDRMDDRLKHARRVGLHLRAYGWSSRKSGGCTWWKAPKPINR